MFAEEPLEVYYHVHTRKRLILQFIRYLDTLEIVATVSRIAIS